MTRTLHRTATASAGVALLVVLTACGGGGEEGGEGSGGGSTSRDDLPKGVIDQIYEDAYGGDNQEVMDERMMEVENRVAACMSELGFEYIPVDWSKSGGFSGDDLEVEWGTLEFAEKYGYGATTNPWGETEGEPTEEFVDPNQAITEAMSESELQAYSEALWGPGIESEGDEPVEYDWQTAGCQGKAQHEVDVENGLAGEEVEALQTEMETMWEAAMNDPRIAELHAEWASCMADAGFEGFAAPEDAESSIYDKVNAVYDEMYQNTTFDENTSEEEWEALNDQVQERLSSMTEEEIKTAVADFTCREEIDLARVQAEISVEHQQDFYDSHKAEVDAWRDSLAGA